MSAETIPAEVETDLDCIRWYVECLDAVAFKRRAVAGLAEAECSYNAAMKRLADRSTRPAEPAAPVAEVVGYMRQKDADAGWFWVTRRGNGYYTEPLVRLSTLEAERARDDRLERERDWQYEENVARIAAQGAAEQRAANALARAEKAEGALETAQSHLTAIFGIETHSLHVGYDQGSGGGNFVYAEVIRTDDPAFVAARASREAQPATDGGEA